MSGSVSYVFYAVDRPLSHTERAQVARFSRRAHPTARRADFWYNVDGYDLPVPYESLLAQYYDIVVRQDYEQWTLGMAWPYDAAMHDKLKAFECDDGEGDGIRVMPIDAGYPRVKRKITKETRLLTEITAYLDYEVLESVKGLRELPWDRSADEGDDEEDLDYAYESEGSPEETLVLLTNCIREDVARGDMRAFYVAWAKFRDPESRSQPEPPKTRKRLAPYLARFGDLLKASDEL